MVGYKPNGDEAHRSYKERDSICTFIAEPMLEFGNERRPKERAHRLHTEDHTYPTSSVLEGCVSRVDTIPTETVDGNSTIRISPHIHESSPAEELHKANGPESGRRLFEELDKTLVLFWFILFFILDAVELRIFLRVKFLYSSESIERAEDEDCCARIERPLDGIGNDAFRSRVSDTNPSKENREEVTYHRTGITERGLDSVGRTFLLLVYHIANHHLKRLHSDVDGCIKEHQAEEPEPHSCIKTEKSGLRKSEVSCVRQKQHHRYSNERTYKQIGFAATETSPSLITILTHQRLHNHTHQRR